MPISIRGFVLASADIATSENVTSGNKVRYLGYAEDGYQIFTGGLQPENFPDLRDHQPAAILVVEQGTVIMDSEGELHNIGIIDKRQKADTALSVFTLTQPSLLSINERLVNVQFDHHYPVVSDITEAHPYWNHEEAADQTGGAARTVVRFFSHLSYNLRGGQKRYNSGGKGMGSSGSGGNGGDDRFWHWRVAQIKKRSLFLMRRNSWELAFVWIPAALITGATYKLFVDSESRINELEQKRELLSEKFGKYKYAHYHRVENLKSTVSGIKPYADRWNSIMDKREKKGKKGKKGK